MGNAVSSCAELSVAVPLQESLQSSYLRSVSAVCIHLNTRTIDAQAGPAQGQQPCCRWAPDVDGELAVEAGCTWSCGCNDRLLAKGTRALQENCKKPSLEMLRC